MAPDPPRVGDECLPTVNSNFLIVTNSDESDSDFNEIDDYMQVQGYTLFTDDINDPSFYHNNSSLFDDDDSEQYDSDGNNVQRPSQNGIRTPESDVVGPDSSVAQESESSRTEGVEFSLNCSNNNTISSSSSSSEVHGSSCGRSDIKIDCNQVKAAMMGFTLPPSAIPPWAVGVTDQDITSHVNRLLSGIDKNK